jgi:hypothetical protein
VYNLQACAALPDGIPLKGYAVYQDLVNYYMNYLTLKCRLPTGTLMLPKPALNTCGAAAIKYESMLSSIDRYILPVCMHVLCLYVVYVMHMYVHESLKHVCVYSVGGCMCMGLCLSGSDHVSSLSHLRQ